MYLKSSKNAERYIKQYRHFYNALFALNAQDVADYDFFVLFRFKSGNHNFHIAIPSPKASTMAKSGKLFLFEDYKDGSTLIGTTDYQTYGEVSGDTQQKCMYLSSFIVRSASAGKGIGTLFMNYVKEFAKKLKCNKILLACDNNIAIIRQADQQKLVNVAGYFYFVKNDYDLSVSLRSKDLYNKSHCLTYEYNLDSPTPKTLKKHFATLQNLEDFTVEHLEEVARDIFTDPNNFKRYQ